MGLFKKIGKALKKVGKVAKKALPIAASFIPGVGGIAAKVVSGKAGQLVSKGAKAASALKSSGTNITKAMMLPVTPTSVEGLAGRQADVMSTSSHTLSRRSTPKAKKAAKPKKKKSTTTRGAALKKLYKIWKADPQGDWESFAASELEAMGF